MNSLGWSPNKVDFLVGCSLSSLGSGGSRDDMDDPKGKGGGLMDEESFVW